ncbi:PadR family transcriptional regulator [Nocardia zapadnayensis]|uniref:PadR family transcriptional regulator n=1 Tax=Nocardia rhamnosiphila TaxID=426716 RepID=UPI0022487415|nr:PadR family transcriptional regulator [Nocardia zapadnayensis]MCX0271566.1 PadR family transcriptional regulator [Nocardia zapadnayensis]
MREFQRAAVRLHILHHATTEEVHDAWMTEELARHGYMISPGTLYPTLHRLEGDGLLTSRQQTVEGRMRRVYRATDAGRAALAEDRRALRELAREVLAEDSAGRSVGCGCCGAACKAGVR